MPAADSTTATMAAAEPAAEPNTKVDLSLLDPWNQRDSSNTSTPPQTDLQKLTCTEAFQSRLRTFLPLTYFCKPASLSPIVCARFGWINTSVDMLKCSVCKAALVVIIHPKITKQSTIQKLVQAYQTKLATSHKATCPFRFEAQMHLVSNNNSNNQKNSPFPMVVPSHFVSILPPDVWEMLEKPKPLPLLRKRLATVLEHLVGDGSGAMAEGEPPRWKFPPLVLPQEVLKFGMHHPENKKQRRMLSRLAIGGDPLDEETLLTKLEEMLMPQHDYVRAQTRNMDAWEDLHEGATALALLGWEPCKEAEDSGAGKVSMQCPVCLNRLDFSLQKHDDDNPHEQEPPSKKRRTSTSSLNPLRAHRFHCPYVCGFPRDGARKTTPIWEIVASKLVLEGKQKKNNDDKEETAEEQDNPEANDGQAAEDRIMALLQSGVSSRVGKNKRELGLLL